MAVSDETVIDYINNQNSEIAEIARELAIFRRNIGNDDFINGVAYALEKLRLKINSARGKPPIFTKTNLRYLIAETEKEIKETRKRGSQ